MSRHEGVSCDVCEKSNFRGKRFKCLICYDYDLCCTCYDNKIASGSHSVDHPMQCILTRADHEIFFGGENVSYESAQSFTCPLCGQLGFSERRLQEHVVSQHESSNKDVLCPLCVVLPGWDPNTTTDSLVAHLALEHRSRQSEYHEDGPSLSSQFRRMLHARAANSSSRGRGGSHRSPFSFGQATQQLRREQPQAFSTGASTGNGSSGAGAGASSEQRAVASLLGGGMALSATSPQYSPSSPSDIVSSTANPFSILPTGNSEGGGGGGSSSNGSAVLPPASAVLSDATLSQDLVDFITQMSHGEQTSSAPIPYGNPNQYAMYTPEPVSASSMADFRRLERSNARRFYSAATAQGGSGGGGGKSSSQGTSSSLNSQWECLMGTVPPTGDFVLARSLDEAASRAASSDTTAETERWARSAFSQELLLSMLDVTLDSSLLEHLEQLSSESDHDES